MSLLNTIETVVKSNVDNQINLLTSLFGIPCRVYRPKSDVYSEVYGGSNAYHELEFLFEKDLLVIGDAPSPIDFSYIGTLQEAYLFTTDNNIECGYVIEILRDDNRIRKYKIEHAESLGATTSVFKKFRLSAIGGE